MVVPIGNNFYSITDTATGARHGTINAQGQLVAGPVISADQCTMTLNINGSNLTHVFKLPSGHLIQRF
jgi:hypothetical protein